MTCFLTVFQSYQDHGRVIMKAVCNGAISELERAMKEQFGIICSVILSKISLIFT